MLSFPKVQSEHYRDICGMWYFTAEMVPLSLFSTIVPDEEKQASADRLMAVKPQEAKHAPSDCYDTGFGKPKFLKYIDQSTILLQILMIQINGLPLKSFKRPCVSHRECCYMARFHCIPKDCCYHQNFTTTDWIYKVGGVCTKMYLSTENPKCHMVDFRLHDFAR